MVWDAEQAAKILDAYDNCYFIKPVSGKKELVKTHRYKVGLGLNGKHIAVARERNEGAVTAYVNFRSLKENAFQDGAILGVAVTGEYFPGHEGNTGDLGISASVAKLETLNPKFNHVLRLDIEGPSAFATLLNWYRGLKDFPAPVVSKTTEEIAPVLASESDTDIGEAEDPDRDQDVELEGNGNDWSLTEVNLAVSDYFSMLTTEAQKNDLNKSAHNAELRALLNRRSKGSVEFKHQNISAVLSDLGLPYIRGYKPRGNYQQILRERVEAFIASNPNIMDKVFQHYEVVDPDEAAFDAFTQVDAPRIDGNNANVRAQNRLPRKLDFAARDEQNRALGLKGEDWVYRYEKKRLREAGLPHLAEQVKWIARDVGDGTGYDIMSFNEDGGERYIEVKTTNSGANTPFYVSKNEVDFSHEMGDRFFLYRVFNFDSNAKFYVLQGSIKENAKLEVTSYRALPVEITNKSE